MRVAIPTWENRISPVFDTAMHLLVVDIENNREIARKTHSLAPSLRSHIETLTQLGIDRLICGAITRPLFEGLVRTGIQIIPNMCGNVEEILKDITAGKQFQLRFAMPGCRGQRHRRSGRWMNRNIPYNF